MRCLVRATIPGLASFAAAVLLLAGARDAGAWEQRKNTVSFGFEGGVNSLQATGDYAREGFEGTEPQTLFHLDDYRWGPALGVRLRYSLDRTHAVGMSFEDLRYRRKSGVAADVAKQVQVNTVFLDYYVYFARKARLTPYLVLGGGFHRTTFRSGQTDATTPPLGLAANLGAGVEYFVRPPFAIQAAFRGYYFGFRGSGEWEYDGPGALAANLQLGFHYYLLK